MSVHDIRDLLEMVVIGIPMWWGLIRLLGITKDFPLHRHVGKRIMYPANVDKDQFDTIINGEKS